MRKALKCNELLQIHWLQQYRPSVC